MVYLPKFLSTKTSVSVLVNSYKTFKTNSIILNLSSFNTYSKHFHFCCKKNKHPSFYMDLLCTLISVFHNTIFSNHFNIHTFSTLLFTPNKVFKGKSFILLSTRVSAITVLWTLFYLYLHSSWYSKYTSID